MFKRLVARRIFWNGKVSPSNRSESIKNSKIYAKFLGKQKTDSEVFRHIGQSISIRYTKVSLISMIKQQNLEIFIGYALLLDVILGFSNGLYICLTKMMSMVLVVKCQKGQ